MEEKVGILLQSHFVNNMQVGGELGWFAREFNASTGYTWGLTPDNSGVYEVVEKTILHPSTDAIGVPGMIIWKIKAKKEGTGRVSFELTVPSGEKPAESILVEIKVTW